MIEKNAILMLLVNSLSWFRCKRTIVSYIEYLPNDYHFYDPAPMTKEEREMCCMQRKLWKLIAADMEKQKQDPLLFPGKASNELLKKVSSYNHLGS